MTISSRTPEGFPSHCPVCGARSNIEFSEFADDASCPRCGQLLWKSARIFDSITVFLQGILNTKPELIKAETKLDQLLEFDSLGQIEFVMLLEEELNVIIPERELEQIETIGDLVRVAQPTETD